MAKFYYYYYCCCYLCRSIVGSIIDRQYLCNLFAFERRVASIQRTGKWFVEEVYTLCSDEKFLQFLQTLMVFIFRIEFSLLRGG